MMSTLKCLRTGLKLAVFTVFFTYYQLSSFKRYLNGNGKKNSCLHNEKYTLKEKKLTKFIFKQILNTVFGVFLKIDNRAFTDLTNKMQQTCRYS